MGGASRRALDRSARGKARDRRMAPPVVIVGAGVAGLTLALALRERGIDAQVYERADSVRTVGGALLLWTNAVRVLDALGVGHALRDVAVEVMHTDFCDERGALLWRLPVAEASRRHGAPSLVVARADLVRLLARAVGHDHILLDHAYVGHE